MNKDYSDKNKISSRRTGCDTETSNPVEKPVFFQLDVYYS